MAIQLQNIRSHIAKKHGITLTMARADLVHPLASGNKIYKIMPNIKFAKANNYTELLSFGGAYSNHIHALAHMAKKHDLKSIGIIRGEEAYAQNPTLQDAQTVGMQLEFVTRKDYKCRNDKDYLQALQHKFPKALIVPEGGSSQLAISGCAQLAKDINHQAEVQQYNVLAAACGTGATIAGLVCGADQYQTVIGYSVLRDKSLENRVTTFVNDENCSPSHYKIENADFGGYAKISKELIDFILEWLEQTGILLDPIYTSKMCMKIMQQIKSNVFKAGTNITLVHTGGLQGWRGMKMRVIDLVGFDNWKLIENYLQVEAVNNTVASD